MIKNYEYCAYTYLHRKALVHYIQKNEYLLEEEKETLLIRAKVHDMDKLTLYLFRDKEEASKYHRIHSSHHITINKEHDKYDLLESIFDYECAALTKPDKPLNAYDTVLKRYPELKEEYLPILERLHMNSSYIAVSEEDKNYINQFSPSEELILKEVSNYLKNNQKTIYHDLKDNLCTKEEYEKLLTY